jgi:hypothetical protein
MKDKSGTNKIYKIFQVKTQFVQFPRKDLSTHIDINILRIIGNACQVLEKASFLIIKLRNLG